MSRYGEVIERFKAKRLDGAFLSSYTATMGINELDLLPVANPVNLRGQSTSQGYIFVRRDRGIRNVHDMRGQRIVFVDPATMEGYLFPLAYLHKHGVADINDFFKGQFYFSGSHASAIFAVLDGRADIGAAKSTVFQQLIRNDPSIGQELLIIAQSRQVPEVTLCIKQGLDGELRQKLQNELLQMNKSEEGRKVLEHFRALRFIKSEIADFAAVDKLAREAKASIVEHGSN
jgi:phosphonate transport system substrate-binding protein